MRDWTYFQSQRRALEHQQQDREHDRHEQHAIETVVRDRKRLVDLRRPGHPCWCLHWPIVRSEDVANDLLQDQANTECGEQSLERPSVKKTYYAAFYEHTHRAADQECNWNRN